MRTGPHSPAPLEIKRNSHPLKRLEFGVQCGRGRTGICFVTLSGGLSSVLQIAELV